MPYAVLSEGARCGFFILTRSPEARGGLRSEGYRAYILRNLTQKIFAFWQ